MDSSLALTGWEEQRRVVVPRRPLQGEMLLAQEDDGLGFIEANRKDGKRITGYEYVLVVGFFGERGWCTERSDHRTAND